MSVDTTNEKRFEADIEASFLSPEGGYVKGTDTYDPQLGLYVDTLIDFIKKTQPKAWARFENTNKINTVRKFCESFNDACKGGLLEVLRHGFRHRGITFRVCYFKPESSLNQTAAAQYAQNHIACYRQWYYSATCKKSVDMVLVLNGIPVFAFELKNQYTGQTVDNAKRQWMYDRDPREVCFQFNKRILGYFAVDHFEVWMTTKLAGKKTYFLPFNQGSNGAGRDGGKGNPANPNGYPTAYLWEQVFQKDSMMDILQKFIHLQDTKEEKKRLIFPRYHQLDAVRKMIAHVSENGAGHNYLIQHSAGSGKSNSIAWTAYRLASLHDNDNNAIFSSVIVVTDRRVLDAQLQETINGFDHTLGAVATIGEGKTSRDLLDAINAGTRIIVTTLQKFPVIYEEVNSAKGRNYAVIVDEAHSSQTGSSSLKLKSALADTEEALREYAELEGKEEEEIDKTDKIVKEMLAHGRHKNLSFFAFTATPKPTTLEMFGTECEDGSFRPFHIYSMRQAIEEGFILDVLQNYMTYDTCFQIAKNFSDNPDVPSSTAKIIRKFAQLHPYNIGQKAKIIVETYRETTRHKIGGRGKMMVVTSSRLAAVRYYHACRQYIEENGYDDIGVLVAFSGSVQDVGAEYTESKLNVRKDGSHIGETQTKSEFHDNFHVLIVAEKYQTGFDEPLLHTMIVDKKLRGVKAVQTLSRLNRTCPGKDDTFVLDFINTQEDIQQAFQPFYQETMLEREVNTDLLYDVVHELRDYSIYSDVDIEKFYDEYYSNYNNQDSRAMGRMTSILKPVADRYNRLSPDERYQFRRLCRNMIKWYGYITQIVRMFDEELHKEYKFLYYLIRLIPEEKTQMIDLEGKLKLEYYKLQKTADGAIMLKEEPGVYQPASAKGAVKPEEKLPLDEIIEKINEQYKGEFTDADRVLLESLKTRLMSNTKLQTQARSSDLKIFAESIFPKYFGDAAQESYAEAQQTYTKLFEDKAKYQAIMQALSEIIYRDMQIDAQ
ncbi:type I restriction endonuclease subunit R [bacterium]|nr:type I restriction endonuclease subunit R [bacterium]